MFACSLAEGVRWLPYSSDYQAVQSRTLIDSLTSVARWVSIAGHPFVTTLVLAAAVDFERGAAAAARTAAAVGVLFVLPIALVTVVQVRRSAWTTVDASQPGERPVLFAVGAAGLLAVLLYFARTQPRTPLVAGTAGVLAMLGLCAASTPWVKVSLHVAAAALAATVLLWRGIPLGWLLVAGLPVLAWSRVALRRHQWAEVAAGLVLGAVTGTVVAHLG